MARTIDGNERVGIALEMHARGYNCAQAVACSLADLAGYDEDTCFRMMEAFGGGMGGHTETCGAISGAAAAVGFASSNGAAGPVSKQATYEAVRLIPARFREKVGSTVCSRIKGENGQGNVCEEPLRTCDGCIEDAVIIACDLLEERKTAEPRTR